MQMTKTSKSFYKRKLQVAFFYGPTDNKSSDLSWTIKNYQVSFNPTYFFDELWC